MTADPAGVDQLPLPPRSLPAPGFSLESILRLVVCRLHWEANPLRPKRHSRGRYRFDAPRDGAEYPVTYANAADHGAIGEVFGDTQIVAARDAGRRLSEIASTRPLQIVALDNPKVQKALGLDGRIAMSKQYRVTMMWSRFLHRSFPDADGVRYESRHAGGASPNFCLYLDRCRADLTVTDLGALGDPALRKLVLDAADQYHLAVLIPQRR